MLKNNGDRICDGGCLNAEVCHNCGDCPYDGQCVNAGICTPKNYDYKYLYGGKH